MTDFPNLLDQAAATLLKQAGLTAPAKPDEPASDEPAATADLAERVKAFSAVFAYAKDRAVLTPKEKEPSAIEKMRAALASGGEGKSSRRKQAKAEETPDEPVV